MKISIRDAKSKDYADISSLTLEVHRLHLNSRPDVYRDVDDPLQAEFFSSLLKEEDTKVFVAEADNSGELVGYGIVKLMKTASIPLMVQCKYAYIDSFCVKVAHKKKGIGRVLFQHILEYSKEQQVASLQLKVWEFNKDAIKFYEAMGMNTRNRVMELSI